LAAVGALVLAAVGTAPLEHGFAHAAGRGRPAPLDVAVAGRPVDLTSSKLKSDNL
jgi:hypothetical protein